MQLKDLLECSPERVNLLVAARYSGQEAAEKRFKTETNGHLAEEIYLPDRIEEDKVAKVEFAVSYLIRLAELRNQKRQASA